MNEERKGSISPEAATFKAILLRNHLIEFADVSEKISIVQHATNAPYTRVYRRFGELLRSGIDPREAIVKVEKEFEPFIKH